MIFLYIALIMIHYVICFKQTGFKRFIIPSVFGLLFIIGILSIVAYVSTPPSISFVDPSVGSQDHLNQMITGLRWLDYLLIYIYSKQITLLLSVIPMIVALGISSRVFPENNEIRGVNRKLMK